MILGSVSPSSVWAARVLPSEVARRPAISVVQQSHAHSKHAKAKRNKKRIVFPLSACLDCMKRMAALLPRVPHPSAAACLPGLQPRAARGGLIQKPKPSLFRFHICTVCCWPVQQRHQHRLQPIGMNLGFKSAAPPPNDCCLLFQWNQTAASGRARATRPSRVPLRRRCSPMTSPAALR